MAFLSTLLIQLESRVPVLVDASSKLMADAKIGYGTSESFLSSSFEPLGCFIVLWWMLIKVQAAKSIHTFDVSVAGSFVIH